MTRVIRVLIADDELLARRRLRRLLSAMADVEIVAECEDGGQAAKMLAETEVDIAVLDIQMPNLTGMDVAALAARDQVVVIFTTAHPEHAVDAFSVGAVDYVVKPIDAKRLDEAMRRAIERLSARNPDSRLALSVRGEIQLVDPADITHAVLDGKLVVVYLTASQILTDLSLSELSRRLPPDRFLRVHRRAIVNMARVKGLVPQESGGYLARTDNGHEVVVSRQCARMLRRRFGI